MRNTLVCTVGTSLFESNLKRLSENSPECPKNWQSIKTHFDSGNWNELAKELLNVDPSNRTCGAEINTIEEAKKKKWLELKNLIFLVSDTEAGKNTGYVLKKYYEGRPDLKLEQVDFEVIEQLQDEKPKNFKIHGLRNLVRKVGDLIQRFGNEYIAIDATGGYKAQIAVAVLIGQALDIPVYYKHEKFSEIIDFPPLPISLDYDILGRNSDILTDFERGKSYSRSEIDNFDEKLRVFLTEIEIDNEPVFELNAIGQLYLTSFRLRYPKVVSLKTLSDNERKEPTFGNDHHYPIGFKEFVEKVWRENKWIKTCRSLSYHGQQAIKGIGFTVKTEENKNIIVGTYQDKNNFGARFQVVLSDESSENLNWAADQLNQKYR
ncbi:MAG TPA: putative CRISPR-associated protein [Spirochaetota bacterium]|nr:putative CRISPR-associated protein [Spirochaetota bacterium]